MSTQAAAGGPPGSVPSARALVVDCDAVSRRFAEHALTAAGFAVESVNDAASAIELLGAQLVDLIVCEMDLPDQSGLALVRRLRQENRLREIPFVFLAADRRPETRVAALRAGVDDYLVKPCVPVELAARCESLVQRRRRLREAASERGYSLAGDYSAISFPDLISLLELGRRSGVLSLVCALNSGEVHFEKGQVVHATFGNLAGREAFYRLFEVTSANFEFTPGAAVAERTIAESVMSLVMEAARRFDTAHQHDGPPASAAAPASPRLAIVPDLPPVQPTPRANPGAAPDLRIARQLERALGDGFTLGELQLFSNEDLERWSSSEVGRDRVQIHLLADPTAGVAALLPLGGAPNERWVLHALEPGPKSFGVSFFLRNERTLDLLLLDARDLGRVLPSLRRVPAVSVIAPPGGELLGLGTRGRTTLDAYLRQIAPPAVLGFGNASLEANLRALLDQAQPRALLHCEHGQLGATELPLRELVARGLRLWAQLAENQAIG